NLLRRAALPPGMAAKELHAGGCLTSTVPHLCPLPTRGRETLPPQFHPIPPTLMARGATAESPSPLWGGVRGRGAAPYAIVLSLWQKAGFPSLLGLAALAALRATAFAGTGDLPAARTDLSAADLARVQAVTRPTADFSKAEDYETMQGGAGTSRKRANADAFSQPSANITFEQQATFKLGNALFRKNWEIGRAHV